MSKADYFKELNYRLRGLPEKERQNILKVYEELFQKAVENGKHEDEVALSLGYPRVPNWDAQNQKDSNPAGPQQVKVTEPTPRTYEAQDQQPEDLTDTSGDFDQPETFTIPSVKTPEPPAAGSKIPAQAPEAW